MTSSDVSAQGGERPSDPASEIKVRRAIRGLIFDTDANALLLIKTLVPDSGAIIWLAPGGGLESDETPEQCLYRELYEETGLVTDHSQGPVWHRRHQFALRGQQYDQQEQYFWVPAQHFDPDHTANPATEEKDIFRGFKWWTLEEIERAGRERTGDLFVPLKLGKHLAHLLSEMSAGRFPSESVDVGI